MWPTKKVAQLCCIFFDSLKILAACSPKWQNVFLQTQIDFALRQNVVKNWSEQIETRPIRAHFIENKQWRYWRKLLEVAPGTRSKDVPIAYASDRPIGISNDAKWKKLFYNYIPYHSSKTVDWTEIGWMRMSVAGNKDNWNIRRIGPTG